MMLHLEVGGHGLVNTGLQFSGGGRGVTGALRGVAIASVLNNATRKITNDSFIRITSRHAEMVLTHSRHPPEVVRNTLSMMFVRYQNAARPASAPSAPGPPPPGPLDELERLTRLHAAGTLTDNEFEAARLKQIRRLRDDEG
jgi:hypothetical protein